MGLTFELGPLHEFGWSGAEVDIVAQSVWCTRCGRLCVTASGYITPAGAVLCWGMASPGLVRASVDLD